MPNGHDYTSKEYGGHKYASHPGTSDCEHGCGCWMSAYHSGGPLGLDPDGTCPMNPKDGELLGGNADYEYVVNQRIHILESRLQQAEKRLKQVEPSQAELADKLQEARAKLAKKEQIIALLSN